MAIPDLRDLRENRNRDLLRRLGTDIETDRAVDPSDLSGAPAVVSEPSLTLAVCAAAAHGADIARRRRTYLRKHWSLEPGVMAEQNDIRSPIELDSLKNGIRPTNYELVHIGKALICCPGGACVGDDHSEAEMLGDDRQRLRNVTRPEYEQYRRGRQCLDVYLAVTVRERSILLVFDEDCDVGEHISGYVGGYLPGDDTLVRFDNGFEPDIRTLHDRYSRAEALSGDEFADGADDAHHFSMYTEIVPPQVRPTSKASSSAMP